MMIRAIQFFYFCIGTITLSTNYVSAQIGEAYAGNRNLEINDHILSDLNPSDIIMMNYFAGDRLFAEKQFTYLLGKLNGDDPITLIRRYIVLNNMAFIEKNRYGSTRRYRGIENEATILVRSDSFPEIDVKFRSFGDGPVGTPDVCKSMNGGSTPFNPDPSSGGDMAYCDGWGGVRDEFADPNDFLDEIIEWGRDHLPPSGGRPDGPGDPPPPPPPTSEQAAEDRIADCASDLQAELRRKGASDNYASCFAPLHYSFCGLIEQECGATPSNSCINNAVRSYIGGGAVQNTAAACRQ